jgi:ketosteroid isomerase-like protein
MILNNPVTVAQVAEAVDAYEQALMDNDVAALDGAFWNSPHTVRLGVAENLYGFDQIAAYRLGRAGGSPSRTRLRTQITTFGDALAIAHVEFQRDGSDRIGRQSQTWIRTANGWKVASAHVSLMQPGVDQRLAPPEENR